MIERSGTRLVAVVGLVALCSTQAGLALAADGPSAPAAPPAPPAAEPTSEQQAKDKLACVTSYEDAQRLRLANKLLAAREQLRVCRGDVCPGLVRNDCEKWLGEVAESLPSVVLSARDGGGRDLFDVKVTIDGAPLRAGLDGTAVDVDPGAHTIVFVRGSDTKEERVLVRQGEHNRVVVVVLGRSPAAAPLPAPGPAPASTQPPPGDERGPGTRRVVGLVVGAAGLVGLGVGGVLGLTSNGDARELHDTCGLTRSCTQDQLDAIIGRRTVAGVVAGIGGAALVTGIVLYLTAPRPASAHGLAPHEGPASRWTWGAAPVPGGALGAFGASF